MLCVRAHHNIPARTADSGARGCVPLALRAWFLNTLNELIFLLVVNQTLLSLQCAIERR